MRKVVRCRTVDLGGSTRVTILFTMLVGSTFYWFICKQLNLVIIDNGVHWDGNIVTSNENGSSTSVYIRIDNIFRSTFATQFGLVFQIATKCNKFTIGENHAEE